MTGYVLDAATTIMCPHGGKATISPRTTRVTLGGTAPLVLDDFSLPAPVISGCPFNISGAPSPCLRVQWLMPAMRLTIEGSAALLSSSVGLCVNVANAPQGTAIVSGFQTRVQAQ
jgi:hypothetical protein